MRRVRRHQIPKVGLIEKVDNHDGCDQGWGSTWMRVIVGVIETGVRGVTGWTWARHRENLHWSTTIVVSRSTWPGQDNDWRTQSNRGSQVGACVCGREGEWVSEWVSECHTCMLATVWVHEYARGCYLHQRLMLRIMLSIVTLLLNESLIFASTLITIILPSNPRYTHPTPPKHTSP